MVAAIGALLPLFAALAEQETGRDRRFAEPVVAIGDLPDPVLPGLCATHGELAEAVLRDRLCGRAAANSSRASTDRLPPVLARANAQARQAFLAPLRDAQARLAELQARQREGRDDLLELGDAMASAETEVQPFLKRYWLDAPGVDGPLPLVCAYARVEGALAHPTASSPDIARSNAVMLLGAALDGHPATPGLANRAVLPAGRAAPQGCAGLELADALAATSILMADARATPVAAAKNEAMRALLQTAGWQWAAWALIGLALLNLSRRVGSAAAGVAFALAAWAAAAWIGRVPWPLASERAFVLARESAAPLAMPADFVLWLLGAAAAVLIFSPLLRNLSRRERKGPRPRSATPA